MSLWRSPANKRPTRPELLRLDERIVPDTTSATVPTGASTTTTTPAVTSTTTTTTPTVPGTVEVTPGVTGTVTNPIPGSTTTTSTSTSTGNTTTTTTTTTTEPPPAPPPVVRYAVGADAGNQARVRVYDNTGAKVWDFNAYPIGSYRGGVRVAMADMNGDGVADMITAPGVGMTTNIRVFDGVSGQRLIAFDAYDKSFQGGAYVATGDVNGDGRADLVVGAGDTGGSHVKIYDGKKLFPGFAEGSSAATPGSDETLFAQYFAYDPKYNVGARVSVGDVNGDGRADVITGAGDKGGPHVRVFSGLDNTVIREWFAYDPLFNGGVFVSAGDLNGDGKAEVVTGMGSNGNARTNVYDGLTGRQLRSFLAVANANRASVRVGILDIDKDGDNDIVTIVRNDLKAFDGKAFTMTSSLAPFDAGHVGAVFFG